MRYLYFIILQVFFQSHFIFARIQFNFFLILIAFIQAYQIYHLILDFILIFQFDQNDSQVIL